VDELALPLLEGADVRAVTAVRRRINLLNCPIATAPSLKKQRTIYEFLNKLAFIGVQFNQHFYKQIFVRKCFMKLKV